jgi:hypothetical protein
MQMRRRFASSDSFWICKPANLSCRQGENVFKRRLMLIWGLVSIVTATSAAIALRSRALLRTQMRGKRHFLLQSKKLQTRPPGHAISRFNPKRSSLENDSAKGSLVPNVQCLCRPESDCRVKGAGSADNTTSERPRRTDRNHTCN